MDLRTRGRKAARLLGGGALLGVGLFIAGCAVNEMTPPAKAQSAPAAGADAQQPPRPVRAPRTDAVGLRTSFADVVEPAMESVVSIESLSKRRPDASQRRGPFGIPFPFEQEERPDESFGSGVVVRADGIILTNNHVVEGEDTEVRVRFHDNREMRAKVLGTDPLTDIAVLKVEAKDLPALPMGTSSDLRVGDVVFAIGSPFSLSQSVTMGIISATGRSKIGITGGGYEDFIQTDAPINPGNSGGALVDSRGEVIGINTAIFSQGLQRSNAGIGFAVPIDMARNVMNQIVADGRVVRSQLGVRIKEVDAALAKSYGLQRPMGALVTSVERGSPADRAGVQAEDLIVEIDGKGVTSDSQLRLDISSRRPGSEVQLAVLREDDGKYEKRTLAATLRELTREQTESEERAPEAGSDMLQDEDNALRGIAVEDLGELTAADRRRMGLAADVTGVVVTQVDPFSPAGRAGLRPLDVITTLNRTPVTSAEDFRAMAKNVGKDVVRVRVERGSRGSDIIAIEP